MNKLDTEDLNSEKSNNKSMKHIARAGLGLVSGLLFSLGIALFSKNFIFGILSIGASIGVFFYAYKGR